jgi:uncharacterized protein YjbI with pentapeptide repeats
MKIFLLVRPVKLPFLNVELPLLAFFALAPFVVLIIHAYALMHFIMLGKKASRFHNELRRQFPDSETNTQRSGAAPDGAHKDIRDKLRRLLPSNIFVQILAGPPELRTGVFGSMLKLIALMTLVVFPILLLLLLQIQFLPFHDVRIIDAQRAALFLDILFLWLLRPPILADLSVESFGRARVLARVLRGFGFVLAGVISIVALWFSIVVATIPGEWQETALAALDRPRWQITYKSWAGERTKLVSTHDLLFAGEVDETTRRRKSPFSNTLVLPGFNIYEALKIDDLEKITWKEHLFNLRGRHLEQAVLDGADLTKVDLHGAQLQGASLYRAKLYGVEFEGAILQGMSLDMADLRGRSLDRMDLRGVSLIGTQLQGASLRETQLQGALLYQAQLQGASLDEAKLQGALLLGAQLQGASLEDAQLQSVSLKWAQLQGASFDQAAFEATNFSGAFLWRTYWGKIEPANLGPVRFVNYKDATWKPVWEQNDPLNKYHSDPVPWDAKAYAKLRGLMNSIPEGKMRDAALARIEILDCGNPDKTLASCDPAAKPPPEVLAWQKELARASVDDARALATELRRLVCANDINAFHILGGVLRNDRLAETGREAPALVDFIMSKDCPVSAALTGDDRAKLLKIKQDAE